MSRFNLLRVRLSSASILTDLLACQGSSGKKLAGVERNKEQQVAETFHNSVSAHSSLLYCVQALMLIHRRPRIPRTENIMGIDSHSQSPQNLHSRPTYALSIVDKGGSALVEQGFSSVIQPDMTNHLDQSFRTKISPIAILAILVGENLEEETRTSTAWPNRPQHRIRGQSGSRSR